MMLGLQQHVGRERVERQAHEDAVEPHLVGVDGLVPEDTVGFSARLVFQLFHHGLHGEQVLLLGSLLVHAGHEMPRADVVEIIVRQLVAADFTFSLIIVSVYSLQ